MTQMNTNEDNTVHVYLDLDIYYDATYKVTHSLSSEGLPRVLGNKGHKPIVREQGNKTTN